MANPSDWAQLYSHTFAKQETPCREDHRHPFIMSDQISSTTTGMAANSLSSTGSHMAAGTNNMMSSSGIRENFHLSYTPDGRVSKPSRKRTRVSAKKDHTTILNTDISNFRAMVQQFTGAPQSAAYLSSVPRVNLSGNYNSSSGMSYEYNQQAGHQLHPYQQQQQQLMIQLLNNNSNNNRNDHGLDIGVSNVNKLHVSAAKMEKSDGFVIADGNSSSSYEMFPAQRLSSFDHENTRSNNGFVSF